LAIGVAKLQGQVRIRDAAPRVVHLVALGSVALLGDSQDFLEVFANSFPVVLPYSEARELMIGLDERRMVRPERLAPELDHSREGRLRLVELAGVGRLVRFLPLALPLGEQLVACGPLRLREGICRLVGEQRQRQREAKADETDAMHRAASTR